MVSLAYLAVSQILKIALDPLYGNVITGPRSERLSVTAASVNADPCLSCLVAFYKVLTQVPMAFSLPACPSIKPD